MRYTGERLLQAVSGALMRSSVESFEDLRVEEWSAGPTLKITYVLSYEVWIRQSGIPLGARCSKTVYSGHAERREATHKQKTARNRNTHQALEPLIAHVVLAQSACVVQALCRAGVRYALESRLGRRPRWAPRASAFL